MTDSQLRDVFAKDYAALKADTFADEQDRQFFTTHGDRIEAVERSSRHGEYGLGRKPLTAAVASGEKVSSEGLDRLRRAWVDDLADVQRRFTDSILIHEKTAEECNRPLNQPLNTIGQRDKSSLYGARENLATDDDVSYWLSHETAHGVFRCFGHLHLTSEFEKAHPNTIFGGEYISSHPEELGVTYERVANRCHKSSQRRD